MKNIQDISDRIKIVQKHIDALETENDDDIDIDLNGENKEYAEGFLACLEWVMED